MPLLLWGKDYGRSKSKTKNEGYHPDDFPHIPLDIKRESHKILIVVYYSAATYISCNYR
jgi:hypothetical protein